MKYETRIHDNNQVMIPSYFVKKHNLESEDIVEWTENEKVETVLKFKKISI